MNGNGKIGWALLLITCGGLIALNQLGFSLGGLFGYLIPIMLVVLGYVGIRNGRSVIGWILAIIGGLLLLGKLSWLIGLAIAVGMICYGVSLLKNRNRVY